ncbi:MAG: hypothetical protein ACRCXC_06920 [Legionella sp.]
MLHIQISQNGLPFDEETYLKICLAAVNKNADALMYIDNETIKEWIIAQISPMQLLENAYQSINYFPSQYNTEQLKQQFLRSIEHIVVVDGIDNKEIQDSYLVYANKEKRHGKTLLVDVGQLETVLEDMRQYGRNPDKSTNLVLLDHAQ